MLYSSIIGQSLPYILIVVIASVMAVFVAMPFHEFAHAYVAKKEGDYTAVVCGRYTLAPLAHIDISGFLLLFFFGFGWAKPVPVDSRNFKRGKKSELMVASAGIIMNLILGVLFLFCYMLFTKINPIFLTNTYYGILLLTFLEMSIMFNFTLAFFNLLPIFPLDGYKIVESLSKTENSFLAFMKKYSFVIYLLLIFTGVYSIYYQYTAELLIDVFTKLFRWILRM